MIGAYLGYQISLYTTLVALLLAPLIVGYMGTMVEKYGLEMFINMDTLQDYFYIWIILYYRGNCSNNLEKTLAYKVPELLNFPLIEVSGMAYPAYSMFRLVLSLLIFLAIYRILAKTKTGNYKSVAN